MKRTEHVASIYSSIHKKVNTHSLLLGVNHVMPGEQKWCVFDTLLKDCVCKKLPVLKESHRDLTSRSGGKLCILP